MTELCVSTVKCYGFWQRIIDCTGTETWPIFSRMSVKPNIFKQLFTHTWNGIAVNFRCVSSTPVVLDARLTNCNACKQIIQEVKKLEESDAISKVKHKHSNLVASL